MKEAAGPTIPAFTDIDVVDRLKQYELQHLQPRTVVMDESLKLLKTKDLLPNPKLVSPVDPEIVDYWYVIPGVEPSVGFEDFIRGVACTSLLAKPEYQQAIHAVLMTVAERVTQTGQLPAIDAAFAPHVERSMQIILSNEEPTGWRGLLAFMQGAYWILGFIENPFEARGKGGLSPIDFVDGMLAYFGPLGYAPR